MMWMMRLGEFFQRRVSQAGAMVTPIIEGRQGRTMLTGPRHVPPPPASWTSPQSQESLIAPDLQRRMQQWANRPSLINPQSHPQPLPRESDSSTGSLTQEQVLAEVHRQVQLAMRGHEIRQKELEEKFDIMRYLQRSNKLLEAILEDLTEGLFLVDSVMAIFLDFLNALAKNGVMLLESKRVSMYIRVILELVMDLVREAYGHLDWDQLWLWERQMFQGDYYKVINVLMRLHLWARTWSNFRADDRWHGRWWI